MFVATNRLFVEPEHHEEFEKLFRGNMNEFLPEVEGLRRSTLLRPETEGQPYVSINEFDTEENFRAWVESSSFRRAHAKAQGVSSHVSGNAVETFQTAEDLVL